MEYEQASTTIMDTQFGTFNLADALQQAAASGGAALLEQFQTTSVGQKIMEASVQKAEEAAVLTGWGKTKQFVSEKKWYFIGGGVLTAVLAAITVRRAWFRR